MPKEKAFVSWMPGHSPVRLQINGLGVKNLTYRWIDNEATERLLEDIRRANAGEIEMGTIANAPLLEKYRAVLGRAYALKGIVSGHPRLQDGKEIITSQLFYLDADRGVARTMNNWYRLSTRDQSRGN